MTFTYKLARRIALLRDSAVMAALALVAACANEDLTDAGNNSDNPAATFAGLTLSPHRVVVETFKAFTFRPVSTTGAGDTVAMPVSWSVSGGTINPRGTFFSSTTGTFKVIGRGKRHGTADTSVVVVVDPQPNLDEVEVSPSRVTLTPGGRRNFNADGELPNGHHVVVAVTWAATGGSIDESGIYVAGSVPGKYRVIARHQSSGKADTAKVVIDPPTPSTPDSALPPPDSTPTPPPDTAPTPTVTLRSIALTPASASLQVGQTQQFAAKGTMSDGSTATVSVTYSATGGNVTSAGLFTAGTTAGGFRVIAKASSGTLADTSTVTITAPVTAPTPTPTPVPVSGACLSRSSGSLATISGAKTSKFDNRSNPYPSNTKVDARTASWIGVSTFPVDLSAYNSTCWSGARIASLMDESSSWRTYHSSAGMYVINSPNFMLEGVRIHNFGDGIRFTPGNNPNWTLRGAWISHSHDDCVENDRLDSGTIEDSFFDGCYVGFSARPGNSFQDSLAAAGGTSSHVEIIRNSLVRLQRQVGVYSGPSPSSGGFFKVENDLTQINISWVLENNIFRADGPSGIGTLCLNQHGKFTARNNVLVWLGSGDFPCSLPSGWTLTRDQSVWDNAVADWKARHPNLTY